VCRIVQKAGPNHGKEFYACSRPQHGPAPRCEFFAWATDTQAADRSLFLTGPKRAPPPTAGSGGWGGAGGNPSATNDASGAPNAKRFCPFVNVLTAQLASVQSLFVILSAGVPADLITQFTALSGARASPAEQLGSQRLEFPLRALSAFSATAQRWGVRVEQPPGWLLASLAEWNRAEAKQREGEEGFLSGTQLDQVLPEFMRTTLMTFQREGIGFAIGRRGRVLIGDEMGLGKTVQALATAYVYRADWPLLIVCPSSLRLNWRDELFKWLGSEVDAADVRVIMKGSDADLGGGDMPRVTIVSYELAPKLPEWQLTYVGVVVCDESHYLKNRAAKRTKFVCGQLLPNVKRVLLLTGTPAMSRPSDLYPQLSALAPKLFGTWTNFTERYCAARRAAYGWDTSGSSNLEELHTLLCDTVLIRRLKKDVLTQLLPKQRSKIFIETAPAAMKVVEKAMADQMRATMAYRGAATPEDCAVLGQDVKAATARLEVASCEAKVAGVCGYVKELLDASPGLKFLLFAHHQSMLDKLEAHCRDKLKVSLIRIDGGTPQGQRQGLTQRFQTDDHCQVALLGITAAGVGLTLTAAHTVVFAELWWTPGALIQAEDRVHRIGQKNSVDVRYLLAKSTIDDQMWSIVSRKLSVLGRSLDGAAGKMDVRSHVDNDECILECRGVQDDWDDGEASGDEDRGSSGAASGGGAEWPTAGPAPRPVPQRTRKGYMTIERGFANAVARQAGGGPAGAAPKRPRRGASDDSDWGNGSVVDVDGPADEAVIEVDGGASNTARAVPGAVVSAAWGDPNAGRDTFAGVDAAAIFPEAPLRQLEECQRRTARRPPLPPAGGDPDPPPPAGAGAPAPLPPPRLLAAAASTSARGGPPPSVAGGPAPARPTVDADEAMALRLRALDAAAAAAEAEFGTPDGGALLLE